MVKSLKVIMFSKSLTRMGTLGYRTGDKWVPILVQEECVVPLVLGLRVQPLVLGIYGEVLVILRWLLSAVGSWVPPYTSKNNVGTIDWRTENAHSIMLTYMCGYSWSYDWEYAPIVYVWVRLILGLRVPTLLNMFVRVSLILGLGVPT